MSDRVRLSDYVLSVMSDAGIDDKYGDRISEFVQYLMRSNQQLNLISRKLTVDDIMTDHIADCLLGTPYFAAYNNIADLGTGGGLPGILLAMVYPDKHFDLYDKSVRKCQYLTDAKRDLHLHNVDIHNSLVSESEIDNDAITCRAFKPVCEIVAMTSKYFLSGRPYILYKGRMESINAELSDLAKKHSAVSEVIALAGNSDKERHIVLLHK